MQQTLQNSHDLLNQVARKQPTRLLASLPGEGNLDLLISCCNAVSSRPEWKAHFASWSGYPVLRPTAERVALELFDANFDLHDSTIRLEQLDILLVSDDRLVEFVRLYVNSFVVHLQQALENSSLTGAAQDSLINEFTIQVAGEYLSLCPRGPAEEVVFPRENIEISISPWIPMRRARGIR